MIPKISIIKEQKEDCSTATLFEKSERPELTFFTEREQEFIKKTLAKDPVCTIHRVPELYFLAEIDDSKESYLQLELARKAGSGLFSVLKEKEIQTVQLSVDSPVLAAAFMEGLLLSTYRFDKYKKEKDNFNLEQVFIICDKITDEQVVELTTITRAVFAARDLVNEPLSFLNATQFSKEMERMGTEAGFSVEVFSKQKIEALKMGGLLAVNKGSIDPPTFNILEWKPANAQNKQPVVLVGKGVVYDTGGMSLKPTANSMDYMKSDMAGAAVMLSTLYAVAKNKLPIHVVALIPATDNRPDGNAYVPGDVITMFDGTTVEVRNTDAEGRLILADALSYAKKYNPQLVIDCATLTGAADIVAGPHGAVVMGNSLEDLEKLKASGQKTYERLIEVPLWEEYAKALKSNIADLNNLGSRDGQATIAGKFLEYFTDYKWIHIDAASTSYFKEANHYQPAGGTGFGVRLLYSFLYDSVSKPSE